MLHVMVINVFVCTHVCVFFQTEMWIDPSCARSLFMTSRNSYSWTRRYEQDNMK